MKKTYSNSLALAVLLIVCNTLAFAQSTFECRPVESAVMPIMKKAELYQLYCRNDRAMTAAANQAGVLADRALKMGQIGLRHLQIGDLPEAKEAIRYSEDYFRQSTNYINQSQACMAENERVTRVIRRNDDKASMPKCD